MGRRVTLGATVALAAFIDTAAPAAACGGLVGENGTIQLTRTTTLAAYHDGIERYVTSFQFTGEGAEVGSIIPLPDIPTSVERGGDWTLQRLAREVAPPPPEFAKAAGSTLAAASAEVILEAKIDALDITVLKGGAQEVGKWALDHNFFLTPDAPEVLEYYAQRSPIFMAARFDASRAKQLNQRSGDGTPIMLTIPTDEPWVPLRILGLGATAGQFIEADVFLLTDDKPLMLAGQTGLKTKRSEQASIGLLDDLRSDKGMEWVPDEMWLNYLQVRTNANNLRYDLAVSTHKPFQPALRDAGVSFNGADFVSTPSQSDWWPPVLLVSGVLVAVAALGVVSVRRWSVAVRR